MHGFKDSKRNSKWNGFPGLNSSQGVFLKSTEVYLVDENLAEILFPLLLFDSVRSNLMGLKGN